MITSSQQKFVSICVQKYRDGWRSAKSHRIDKRWTMALSSLVEFLKTSGRIEFLVHLPSVFKVKTIDGGGETPFE